MITRDEILMGRDKSNKLTPELEENLSKLLNAINKFRNLYGKPMYVSSGYRPANFNKVAGGAAKSNHMVCLAVDIKDPDGKLREFVLKNLDKCKEFGLWMEDFRWSIGWVHFQCVPPKSGKRIFKPNLNPPTDSSVWDGNYDSKYDGF